MIYVSTRLSTEKITKLLQHRGLSVESYHAGLTSVQRNERQEKWLSGELPLLVATKAFGMGIDKPDVSYVIHLELPPTLESYYQEFGRSGRNGQTAYAVMLYNDKDKATMLRRVRMDFPDLEVVKAYTTNCFATTMCHILKEKDALFGLSLMILPLGVRQSLTMCMQV